MNRYEALYDLMRKSLPYYKPFLGLLNDHRILADYLGEPRRIIDTPCFRQYKGPGGSIRSVEEWIRSMYLYEFEPVEFYDEISDDEPSFFDNEWDNCIPAFNEEQAKALYLAHVATNMADSILAEPIDLHFQEFCGKPQLKDVWKVTKFDEFVPNYYWNEEQRQCERFYTKDDKGLALFYLDFFQKFAFERGLIPVGDFPIEIERAGNIYRHRTPFLLAIGVSSKLECEEDYGDDED